MKSNLIIARLPARAFARRPARQRGGALFVVLVIVMLSMLLALWASRSSLFSEMVVGNDADYQRAFEAALALEQDAKLDILNQTANGIDCTTCREAQATTVQIPQETKEVAPLIALLTAISPTQCKDALCTRRTGRPDFWNNDGSATITPAANPNLGEATLAQMEAVGARYGQYTGAGTGGPGTPINPILAITGTATDRGGWYWIEVLPYNNSSQNSPLMSNPAAATATELLPLNLVPNTVYRITALAFGRKPGTKVVLQSTFVNRKLTLDRSDPK